MQIARFKEKNNLVTLTLKYYNKKLNICFSESLDNRAITLIQSQRLHLISLWWESRAFSSSHQLLFFPNKSLPVQKKRTVS